MRMGQGVRFWRIPVNRESVAPDALPLWTVVAFGDDRHLTQREQALIKIGSRQFSVSSFQLSVVG